MEVSVFIKFPPVLHCAPKPWGNAEDALPVPTAYREHQRGQVRGGEKWRGSCHKDLYRPKDTGWAIAPRRGGELGVHSVKINA